MHVKSLQTFPRNCLALNWHKSRTTLHRVIKFLRFKQEHRVTIEITQSGDAQPSSEIVCFGEENYAQPKGRC